MLKNADFMPYIIFLVAQSAEALTVMYEEERRKGDDSNEHQQHRFYEEICKITFLCQSLKVLKNTDFIPYIIFLAAPSAEALTVMYEEGRRKG